MATKTLKLRVLIDDWELEQRVGYHVWHGKTEVPQQGQITVTADKTKTTLTWKASGATTDDIPGMFERFKLKDQEAAARAHIKASLVNLKLLVKSKQKPSRIVPKDAEKPGQKPKTDVKSG